SKCPSDTPLLSYETSSGWISLTHSVFMECCNNIWASCSLGAIFSHGFRIGGTNFLLLSGVNPWIVMTCSSWAMAAPGMYKSSESIIF
ncbi:hypothetical protein L208DRAFT_1139573, partial [Tricholoma matsutake]